MALYRNGSKGAEVKQIQAGLEKLGHYLGPIDGDFGGGTEGAVKAFQRANNLKPDGIVGSMTWAALFSQKEIPAPVILKESLAYRCLALTGAFETSRPVPECFAGLSGNFDGQGISFGALQWNLGQGSLQPLLEEMNQKYPSVLKDIFDASCPVLLAMLQESKQEQLAWASSIQNNRHVLFEPWRGMFKTLGRREEYQGIQVAAANRRYQLALALCEEYGVRSERAVALMFDIKVQNGSIRSVTKAQIQQDFGQIGESGSWRVDELARLRIIANRRAEASNIRWIEDVRTRKLTVANGEGRVHGSYYDLEDQYGIRLELLANAEA